MKCACIKKKACEFLTYKVCGIVALSFCVGMLAGLCLPLAFIAFLEAVLLMLIAYMCLFMW